MRNSNDSVLGKIVLAGASVLGAENAAADVVVGYGMADEEANSTMVEDNGSADIAFRVDSTAPDVREYEIISVKWHARVPNGLDFLTATEPFAHNDIFALWNPYDMQHNEIDTTLDANRDLTGNWRAPNGAQGPVDVAGVASRMYVAAQAGSAPQVIKVETKYVEVIGMDSDGNVTSLPVTVYDQDIHVVPKSPYDINSDGHVNFDDWAMFVDCYDHPGSGLRLGCEPLDFNTNGVIDLHDAAKMQAAYTGDRRVGE